MSGSDGLPEFIADLYRRVAELERRNRNRKRTGTVKEVDHAKGAYRVLLSQQDGKEFLTDWIKPRQIGAGSLKIDVLLTAGEQVDVVSESGDMTDAMIEFSAYSEQNGRQNTDKPMQIKIGEATHNYGPDYHEITVGGSKIDARTGAITLTTAAGHLA